MTPAEKEMSVSTGIRNPVLSEELPGHPGVWLLTFYSPALRRRGDVTMYLPPGARDGPLPLLILMHGVYGSHWNWWALGDLAATANEMLAAGEIAELAIAMPSDGLWGDGSGYVMHKEMDAESWIMNDVPACVQQLFPQVRCDRVYLAGLSMGGYGALRLGAKFAERVTGISAHSAVTSLSDLSPHVEEPLRDYLAEGRRNADVLYWMRRNRAHLPPIRFDCGTEDSLLASNRALHQALRRSNIPHEYEEHPGGHDWVYWKTHVRSTVRFVSDLAREAERNS
jgi:S-formylglutathione hydrolase FrmB